MDDQRSPGRDPEPPEPPEIDPGSPTERFDAAGAASEPPVEPLPAAPADPPQPAEPAEPATPANPLPWERPAAPAAPAAAPRSTIITAEPVLTEQPPGPRPEVAWAPPPPPPTGRAVPGAEGFEFAGTGRRVVAWIIDSLIVALASGLVAGVLAAVVPDLAGDASTFNAILSVLYTGFAFVYFVGLWTTDKRATIGMRMTNLQVGTAFDGRKLGLGQAAGRWALLGFPLGLGFFDATVSGVAGLVSIVWSLVLLISTVTSSTNQGLHDRWTRSVVVQPAGLGRSALVIGCLVIIVGLVVLWILALIALVSSPQFDEIMRQIEESSR